MYLKRKYAEEQFDCNCIEYTSSIPLKQFPRQGEEFLHSRLGYKYDDRCRLFCSVLNINYICSFLDLGTTVSIDPGITTLKMKF